MRVWKNLFGKGDKIAASEIVNDTGQTLNEFTSSVGIQIQANADMLKVIAPGIYYLASAMDASTLKNCPVNTAFRLEVVKTNSDSRIIQKYIQYQGRSVTVRCINNGAVESTVLYNGTSV